jgi:adenosine kinase
MGNPLLDISSEVEADLLAKYDLKLDSAILAEDKHLPLYTELAAMPSVQYIAGGATQNSIRVAQWMLEEAGQTAYMGCVGKDKFGEQLKNCAKQDGVYVHYMEDEATPTGTCAVLVSGGERSLCANLAAANNFKETHLESEEAKQIISSGEIFYSAGFFLTVSVPSLLKVTQHCVENNKTFCLNFSAPFIIDFFGDQVAAALPFADFVFSNESEAEAYGKKHGLGNDGADLDEVALKVCAMPKASGTRPRTVVFTQGANCTIVAREGKVTRYDVEVLPAELLVDTNGAGDAFVGGFLAQLTKGKDIGECVKAGHWASRVIIQRSGCTFPEKCTYPN